MSITIEISPDVEKWLNGKVQSGTISSPNEYVAATLARDFLEEQLEESLREPAAPLTDADWANVRRDVANAGSAKRK